MNTGSTSDLTALCHANPETLAGWLAGCAGWLRWLAALAAL
jgi:hypothetical protein